MVHMCDRVYVTCVWVGEGWVELKYVTDKLLVSKSMREILYIIIMSLEYTHYGCMCMRFCVY